MAFVNAVMGPMPNYEAVSGSLDGGGNRIASPEAPPNMRDQMAQRGSIISRVPQKYLIQNQSGLRVYYWASDVSLCLYLPLRASLKVHSADPLPLHRQ